MTKAGCKKAPIDGLWVAVVRGFTLVELMVAMAVLAIVSVVAIPAFGNLISSNRLNAQANEFLSAITYARSEAIRLNRNIVFCNTTDGATCNADTGVWTQWLVLDPGNGVLQTSLTLSNKVKVLSDAGMDNDTIVFTSMGLARNAINNRLPLTSIIRVCLEESAVNPNVRDLLVSSGGRAVINRSNNNGTCSRPEV
ncbi:MAG: GspH/FimT family pseudopilin [Gammaproteobacteria bacterium]|nr:GspH/FimT family pseudopilin [Gammaproteobacteria bacterium]MBU1556535.1 GspH/FimT family pseudopilin [Gammaproteobacteria bacterium]MBU2071350.1 GspH/FimT family pseudopilin [Gammaproteobacteria bacterium]MBU2182522.1 GspH/FimT family pseudopilin [Gammaproteobacteria bacterium]MBU2204682.1 GspH/FimT family pseudopilin [Gammaproteobacteria bacterium]